MPSILRFENRTGRLLAVYWWPYKKSEGRYAFELLPGEVRPHETVMGYRFRVVEVNRGEILRDVIACESEQIVAIVQKNRNLPQWYGPQHRFF
jgi:hypothetical protein